jgi:hypothetical protein
MKTTIVKPDGTRITIESDDEKLVNKTVKRINDDIKKANQINKIEPIERIEL